MTPASKGNAKESLDRSQREMAALRQRIDGSTRLTTIVGCVVLLALAGWFYYGSRLWAEITEPEKLVNFAQVTLDDNLPTTRKALEEQIIKNAPVWAETLSKELIAAIPDARKELQTHVIKQWDESLKEAQLITEKKFRAFLREKRPVIDKLYKELADDPKKAEASLKGLQLAIEDDFQGDLKSEVSQLLKMVKEASFSLRAMATFEDKDLSEDERRERHVWMLGRALYKQHLEEPIPPAVAPKTDGKQPGAGKAKATN